MTILPKKRNPNPNNKENDKTDGPSTSTSASRNRGLISVIQVKKRLATTLSPLCHAILSSLDIDRD